MPICATPGAFFQHERCHGVVVSLHLLVIRVRRSFTIGAGQCGPSFAYLLERVASDTVECGDHAPTQLRFGGSDRRTRDPRGHGSRSNFPRASALFRDARAGKSSLGAAKRARG
jgi:hypothetical protein